MAEKDYDGIFSLNEKKPRTKADITDAAVRDILREESEEREALTASLRKARLARDAALKSDKPAKAAKPKAPRKRG